MPTRTAAGEEEEGVEAKVVAGVGREEEEEEDGRASIVL